MRKIQLNIYFTNYTIKQLEKISTTKYKLIKFL